MTSFDAPEAAAVYGINEGERLLRFEPKVSPICSPEPTEKVVSRPTSSKGERATRRRRKVLPSKGDRNLLQTAYPNHSDVSRKAEHHLPDPDSGDESMEDVADMDDRISRQMREQEEAEAAAAAAAAATVATAAAMIAVPRNYEQRIKIKALVDEPLEFIHTSAERTKSLDHSTSEVNDLPEPTINFRPHGPSLGSIAASALGKMDLSEPSSDFEADRASSGRHDSHQFGIVGDHKLSNGLGITTVKMEPPATPFPMTPMEPRFSESDSAFVNSPFSRRRSFSSYREMLPALQSPASPEATSPHSNEPLTSAKALIQIADQANEARQRQASLSMTAPSPLPNGTYRASFSGAHPSPSMLSEQSSRGTLALSPPSAFLPPRRESYPTLSPATTNDAHGTPMDPTSPYTLPTPQSDTHRQSIDENIRTLPLPHPDMQRPSLSVTTTLVLGPGAYKCDFPGCNAAPFQTSYLLNSHANVHSTNRPHYCPVSGCPRAEGGKGFKRKNEMIRHGLVHDSPGYVCPFCPDREHKYPRPDNLQRHVRVHHTDKSREDPALRDVLAQRPEIGASRGKRRRLGS